MLKLKSRVIRDWSYKDQQYDNSLTTKIKCMIMSKLILVKKEEEEINEESEDGARIYNTLIATFWSLTIYTSFISHLWGLDKCLTNLFLEIYCS